MDRVLFLDRDGVINKCAAPHEYITSWDKFELLENVPEAIKLMNDSGYKVVIITNQRCIARGIATAKQVEALHERLNEELSMYGAHIDAFYYCPHDIGECNCRKPEIGLFLKAEQNLDVDKSQSYMIGDSESDILAGQRFGVHTIFIGDYVRNYDMRFSSLLEAAKFITRRNSS